MIVLMIFKILKKMGVVDELLVLGKIRIVYSVWPAEIKKWRLDLDYKILHGPKKAKRLQMDTDVWLLNYEGLMWLKNQKAFFRRGKKIMLVCDESSKLKNSTAKRFRAIRKMLSFFDRRYILTGSPVPNTMMDIFGQIYVLDQGVALGRYITEFRNTYFYPSGYMGYEWKLKQDSEKRIFKKLRPLVMRYGTDQLDMPPLTFFDRRIELPSKARSKYAQMEADFEAMLNDHLVTAANAAVVSGKLRQIANGGLYLDQTFDELGKPVGKRKYMRIHDEKDENLVDLIEELNGEPALVVYEFRHDLARLRRYFPDAPAINSSLKLKDTPKLLKQWNEGKIPVMFGQPSSMAHGLNLQGSGGIVIFYSLGWNFEDHEQAIARIWRQGQKRRVIVYRIIANDTVDEVILDALSRKDRNQQALLSAMERRYGKQEG